MANKIIDQTLRTRNLLSPVSPSRSLSSTQYYDRSKPSLLRFKSTLRATSNSQPDEHLSALLHGQQTPTNMAGQHNSSSTHKIRQPALLSHKPLPSAQRMKGSHSIQLVKEPRGHKRKAEEPLPPPPTSRRRKGNPKLRHTGASRVINSNTNEDPDSAGNQASGPLRKLFIHPKDTLHNILGGYAKLTSVIPAPRKYTFRCKLTCTLTDGQVVAVTEGEARSRVQTALILGHGKANRIYRNMPKRPLI